MKRAKTPEFMAWQNMLARCYNKKNPRYKHYGGRGIIVCREWKSFKNFIADMGPRPSKLHSIERRNNCIGYSPRNCYWATIEQQNRNYRRNYLITISGITKCLIQWCDDLGRNHRSVRSRIQNGWRPQWALLVPIGCRKAGMAKHWNK